MAHSFAASGLTADASGKLDAQDAAEGPGAGAVGDDSSSMPDEQLQEAAARSPEAVEAGAEEDALQKPAQEGLAWAGGSEAAVPMPAPPASTTGSRRASRTSKSFKRDEVEVQGEV